MMGGVILLVARRARESSCKKIREMKEQERGKALAKVDTSKKRARVRKSSCHDVNKNRSKRARAGKNSEEK